VSLLAIQGVSKRYRRGRREYVALNGVSLSVESGEVVVVLGTRKSGRSTLLRIAAGLERPDQGRVSFQGLDLSPSDTVIGRRLVYCRTWFSQLEGDVVLDHVAAGLLAQDFNAIEAARIAARALARTGVSECARMRPYELEPAECVRVAIARALTSSPALLVLDEPTAAVGPLQSDPILRLLHSLANDGVAVLMSTSDATCLSGAGRALSLDQGELRGELDPPETEIVPLRIVGSQSEAGAG
jgi:ABC-type ATPase involved in cell division